MKRSLQNKRQYSVELDEEGYPIEPELEDEQEYEPQEQPKKKKSLLRKLIIRLIAVGLVVLLIELGVLLWSGQIWFNEPKKKDFPVRFPVMDSDCGEIYWSKFGGQNIQACYIRATSSTNHVDKRFEKNWEDSRKSNLPVGALHIFDLSADGKAQAENFLSAVGDMTGRLVPAVEISPNILERIFSPGVNEIGTNLRDFVNAVKESTGVTPIIKCSSSAYEKYVKGEFGDCMIWYESLYSQPDDSIDWTFWEYTSRMQLESFEKQGRHLHMSVYRHDEEEFRKLIIGKQGS